MFFGKVIGGLRREQLTPKMRRWWHVDLGRSWCLMLDFIGRDRELRHGQEGRRSRD